MEIINLLRKNIAVETIYYAFSFLVAFDVITGVVKAWKQGRFRSRTMRDGLFASLGEIMLLALCVAATTFMPITETVVFLLIVYMILKELTSIIENLVEIGVKMPLWVVQGLKIYSDKINNLDGGDGING